MRDKLTEIEANIRYMQGFLCDMLWHIQLLDAWYDEFLSSIETLKGDNNGLCKNNGSKN